MELATDVAPPSVTVTTTGPAGVVDEAIADEE